MQVLSPTGRQQSTCELVTEVKPVLLYEGLVALDGAVVGVEQQLGHGAGLAGPVPAVAAVNHAAHLGNAG